MKLLLSVTDEEETRAALAGGADIIDVKNPREGSLGANFPHIIQRIRQIVPPSQAVSAAIGDVPNLPGTVALAGLGAAVAGADYVKVGLFAVATAEDALYLLRQVHRAVKDWNPRVQVIAAGYADAHKVGALAPLLVPEVAAEAHADGCLLDTACKGEGNLFSLLTRSQLEDFVQRCHAQGLLCALAGSLGEAEIPLVRDLGADIVGIRSAACRGDRVEGRIDSQKVRRLKRVILGGARACP